MIDRAYILGPIGKAVYRENGQYFVIGVDSPKEPVVCRSGDVSMFVDCSSEVLSIFRDNLTVSVIKDTLADKTTSHRALSLVLSGLDEDLSKTTRSLSVKAAETLLEQKSVLGFLRARMLARTLPPQADMRGALTLANALGAIRVASLYADISQTQEAIQRLATAWSQVCLMLSLSDPERIEVETELIDGEVFADITATIAAGDEGRVASIITRCAAKPEVKSLSRGSQLLTALQDCLLGVSANNSTVLPSAIELRDDNASPISGVEISEEMETTISGKYESADLILKLYELRRSPVMRVARNWFFTFNPQSASDFFETMPDEHSGHLRMVISYWDMAASLVNNGAIDEQMFNDANGEHLFVFAKIEPILEELRQASDQPDFLRHLETLVRRVPNSAQLLAGIRERLSIIQEMMAERESQEARASSA